VLPGKVVAELSFGFWRFLLARRYTASLWPALRPGFPVPTQRRPPRARGAGDPAAPAAQPGRPSRAADRRAVSVRYEDMLFVVGAGDPRLASWLTGSDRLLDVLGSQPQPDR